MLKHEILSMLRTLRKNKTVSFINILGLTAGLTFVILAARYMYTEKTFDKFHENYRSIYRIEADTPDHGFTCYSPNIMASWLKDTMPDVKAVTRVISDAHSGMVRNLTHNRIKYNIDRPLIVDSDFFSIFSFLVISGEVNSFKRDKSSLALNRSLAERIFGDRDPIGQILSYKGERFTVKAVIEDPPPNSSIRFDVLLPISNIPDYANDASWTNRTLQIFILAAKGISSSDLQRKIQNGILAAVEPLGISQRISPQQIRLNPMKALYYAEGSNDGICIRGNAKITFLIFTIAFIVLVIALINHINASMVKALAKSKELGIRKINGASTIDNVRFLLLELSAPCVISIFLALQFSAMLEPVVNPLLNVTLVKIGIWEYTLLTVCGLFLGALVSLYPAFQSTRFDIIESLKRKCTLGSRAAILKGSLSVLQFAVSTALIISLIVIFKQLDYTNKEGSSNFDKEMVLYMPLADRTPGKNPKISVIRESLKSLAEVREVSSSLHLPGDEHYSFLEIPLKIKGQDETRIQVNHNMVDAGYPEVMGFEVFQGRTFNPELESDYGSYLVNEALIRQYAIHDFSQTELNGSPILGVIKDFHFNSLYTRIEPLAVRNFNSYQSTIAVRITSPSGSPLSDTIEKIRKKVDEIDITAVADIRFLDQHIAVLYDKEHKMMRTLFLMTVFSILISCMGLFSMALFATKSRTKEIGIRKVVGAKMSDILLLLNRDFLKWVIAAFTIALPARWYAMNRWLNNFAYRTTLDWWIFALAGMIALGVALITVSWQTCRTAAKNPAEALRDE
jgi:putative ABC transport system permease protein